MSFSFRNIFSPEEGDGDGDPSSLSPSGFPGFGSDRLGMDPGGPPPGFEAWARSQDFLASELLSFIPPAISARSGIPMEREIRVPLPQDGSRDVRLSTLYQLCPELFAAEITPLNDSVFTLPPRLGETDSGLNSGKAQQGFASEIFQGTLSPGPVGEGTGGLGTGTPPSERNPFQPPVFRESEVGKTPASRPMKEEPRPRSDEPAISPRGPEPAGNPFFASSVPGGNSSAPPASGLAGFSEGGKGEGIVGRDAPGVSEVELNFEGFSKGFSGRSPKAASSSSPADIPGFEMTGGAAQERKRESEFSGNPFESDQGFKTLFSKHAEADLDISPPAGFSLAETNEEPVGVWGSMFSGGGISPAETGAKGAQSSFPASPFESIGNLLQQNETTSSPGTNEPPPGGGKPEIPAGAELKNSEPETSASFSLPSGFASFDPAPPVTHNLPPEDVRDRLREAAETSAAPPQASVEADLAGGSSMPGVETKRSEFKPFQTSGPLTPEPSAPVGPRCEGLASNALAAPTEEIKPADFIVSAPAEKVPPLGAFPHLGSEIRDLELCAIFSTSETFTLSKIARRVVDLPGIVSCTLSTPVKFVQASRSEQTRIGGEAREMVATLRNLASITGLPDARTFTLHTDRGIVSLFLEGECCVTVHHEDVGFRPGVREKLILVARNLITVKE